MNMGGSLELHVIFNTDGAVSTLLNTENTKEEISTRNDAEETLFLFFSFSLIPPGINWSQCELWGEIK